MRYEHLNPAVSTTGYLDQFQCGIPPFLSAYLNVPHSLDEAQAILAMAVSPVAVLLNSLVLILIAKYPSLHHNALLLAIPVVIINLAKCLFVTPLIFYSGIVGTWVFGIILCKIIGYVHDVTNSLRLLFTGIICFDRMAANFFPGYYKRCQGGMNYVLSNLSIIALISSLDAAVISMIRDCYMYIPGLKTCSAYVGCPNCVAYGYSWLAITLVVGIVLPAFFFLLIFCKMRKLSGSAQDEEAAAQQETSNNDEAEHYKDLKKTNIVMVLLLGSVCLSLPSIGLHLFEVNTAKLSPGLYMSQILFGYPLSYLIPVFDAIVVLWHRDVRKKAAEFFSQFSPCRSGRRGHGLSASNVAQLHSSPPATQAPATQAPATQARPTVTENQIRSPTGSDVGELPSSGRTDSLLQGRPASPHVTVRYTPNLSTVPEAGSEIHLEGI